MGLCPWLWPTAALLMRSFTMAAIPWGEQPFSPPAQRRGSGCRNNEGFLSCFPPSLQDIGSSTCRGSGGIEHPSATLPRYWLRVQADETLATGVGMRDQGFLVHVGTKNACKATRRCVHHASAACRHAGLTLAKHDPETTWHLHSGSPTRLEPSTAS